MYNRIKGFLEVNKAGEHPAIFIIAVFINYGLQDKHVARCPNFFCKHHLAIIDHMVFIKELRQSVVKNSIK
jgi:hypothetical protein